MGGWSEYKICPNCNYDKEETLSIWDNGSWSDGDIFKSRGYVCKNCGIYSVMENKQLSLDELNEERKEWNESNEYDENHPNYLQPLEKLHSIEPLLKKGIEVIGGYEDV